MAENVTEGQAWSYEDMANHRRTFIVTGKHVTKFGTEWTLLCETGETITSDLRQSGWKKVAG